MVQKEYPHFNPVKHKLDVKVAVIRTSFHSKHNINYHIIFIPKYRKKILTGKVAEGNDKSMTNLIPIYNARGQEVGQFDLDTKTYITTRDANKGQVFMIPARYGDVAVDVRILQTLAKLECKVIEMLILNFAKKPFRINIRFDRFLTDSELINFDKKMEHTGISTYYSNQKKLNIRKFDEIPDNRQKRLLQCEN